MTLSLFTLLHFYTMNNKHGQLDELEAILNETDNNLCLFVNHLRNLGRLNEVSNAKDLNIDEAKSVLQNVKEHFVVLHIIMDHYEDYFELTDESFLKVSDEITEAVHSR